MKKKILIVIANYYEDISKGLISSAKKELKSNIITTSIIYVPGVFEIPITIKKNIKKYDGFIALGCVIRGQTPHFDFISKSTTDAIMLLSIEHTKPIANGILTCLNKNQAIKRKSKGKEAAIALKSVLSQ